ncbi:Asp-tRNA(Asn)/Glu-tRNA(Gln) amidotransferase subunit GatC [bacterium]|nr:Asp-tRNA(Asn)/Glu-tRNA(Gln) amidotransferase subunit GatC [bacterium]
MTISRAEVEHIALLSRLSPSEAELERLTHDLAEILAFVAKLSELDLSEVPPTSHPVALVNVTAPDEVEPSLDNDTALRNAPSRQGPFFRTPKIVDAG